MSAFLLGIGFRADMGTCARKLVLLKLIDACEDDGTRIFPAIATIARAAQCSTRQVQRELQAFRDIGLIRLVREGGKGPRSTNEYALDLDLLTRLGKEGWQSVAAAAGMAKGDTVSPLDEAEKGDTGDTERVTPETAKGDIACHPTPPDPSLDPSEERARASEREDSQPEAPATDDPRKFEHRVKKLAADLDWPNWAKSSTDWTVAQFAKLTDAERAEAERRAPHYIAATGRRALSLGTYFAERKWADVPEPPAEAEKPRVEAPFGKMWGAVRLARLVAGPGPLPPPRGYVAHLIAQGGEAGERERLAHQGRHGFPAVNRMDEAASRGGGHVVRPDDLRLERIAAGFVPVKVDGELWAAWREAFARRGWPWLPDPGRQDWVYFPAGGPDALDAFEAALREAKDNDGNQRVAAA